MTTQVLRYDANGKAIWVEVEQESSFTPIKKRNTPKEDLTVSQYINKYGGIKSTIDGSIHTSKRSYEDHLKKNNRVICDW